MLLSGVVVIVVVLVVALAVVAKMNVLFMNVA